MLALPTLAGAQTAPNAAWRCLAESRPGFAEMEADGAASGTALALCRRFADAFAGPGRAAAVIMLAPDGAGFPAADVAFLSADEIAARDATAAFIQGPAVFADPVLVLVPKTSLARDVDDLRGLVVCLLIGSPGQRALEARFPPASPGPIRSGFREPVEMLDAYNVGRCEAAVAA